MTITEEQLSALLGEHELDGLSQGRLDDIFGTSDEALKISTWFKQNYVRAWAAEDLLSLFEETDAEAA